MLSGDVGDLFDRMLAKMNRTRDDIWLTSMSPTRQPGGKLSEELLAFFRPIMRHHIDLIGPKRLWLMGQTVSRAFLGADAIPGTGCLRKINHEGRIVEAVASFSPRFLLQQPKQRHAALVDMQALVEGM
jgi:DNA polymerase